MELVLGGEGGVLADGVLGAGTSGFLYCLCLFSGAGLVTLGGVEAGRPSTGLQVL